MPSLNKVHRWPPPCSPRIDGNYFSSNFRYSDPWAFRYRGFLQDVIGTPPPEFTDGAYAEASLALEGEVTYDLIMPSVTIPAAFKIQHGETAAEGPGYVSEAKSFNVGGHLFSSLKEDWGAYWDGFDGTQYATDVTSRVTFLEDDETPPRWAFAYGLDPRQFDWPPPF